MTTTFKTKLGTTRAGERTRIWIEGKRLTDHAFHVGDFFARHWDEKRRLLTLAKIHPSTAAQMKVGTYGKVSGKGDKPIIDITGAKVAATFRTTHVTATYAHGVISIAEAAQ
jgi:hypothetical protein